MVVIIIGFILIVVLLVMFLGKAGKRAKEGKDLGDPAAGNPVHMPENERTV